jgi:hypothetical protein
MEYMDYKRMWYELKKQMLDPKLDDRCLRKTDVIKRMGGLEVREALGEVQKPIKPMDIEIVMPDKLSPEIIADIEKAIKNWDISL